MHVALRTAQRRASVGRLRRRLRSSNRPEVIDVRRLAHELVGWHANVVLTTAVWGSLVAPKIAGTTLTEPRESAAHLRAILTRAKDFARRGGDTRFVVELGGRRGTVALALRRTVGPEGRLFVIADPSEHV